MKIVTDKRVFKDVDKLPKYIQEKVADELENLKTAANLSELGNVEQMKGTDEPYYRMKFSDYRFVLYYDKDEDIVEILSLTHRKDTYKKQNLPWRK
ncbi:MAG: type II toxin-antitoxin system RelE/ParE family toxin [Bacteroidales bacterium]|nr:type II toxin-antitoxin system RelE/ParE family toxin [Bacteroidales bacterium]